MTSRVFLRLFSLGAVLSFSIFSIAYGGAPIQIMPLGDSLTAGYTPSPGIVEAGYRLPLYRHLKNAGVDFLFVGSSDVDCDTPELDAAGQDHHEGHGGYKINDITANLFGNDENPLSWGGYWLGGNTAVRPEVYPDIILLDIGTNDPYDYPNGNTPTAATMADRLDNLLEVIFTNRPNTAVLVANMTPRADHVALSAEYSALIPGLVDSYTAEGRKCYFVDMFDQMTLATDVSADGVHLNASGYQKMADTWFAALQTNGLVEVPEPSSVVLVCVLLGMGMLFGMAKLITRKKRDRGMPQA